MIIDQLKAITCFNGNKKNSLKLPKINQNKSLNIGNNMLDFQDNI
jgi:hypothetical protein